MSLDPEYRNRIESLTCKLSQLLKATPCQVSEYPEKVPRSSGVYLFSEAHTEYLYVGISVGKTNHLRARIGQHVPNIPPGRQRKGSAAILAERIASETLRIDRQIISKVELYSDQDFRSEFYRLRHRIRNMELRWLTIKDKQEATELETFAILVLQPRYN